MFETVSREAAAAVPYPSQNDARRRRGDRAARTTASPSLYSTSARSVRFAAATSGKIRAGRQTAMRATAGAVTKDESKIRRATARVGELAATVRSPTAARIIRRAGGDTDGAVATRKSVYLVGHGVFYVSDGSFTVPENTTVRFFTIPGRGMQSGDSLGIVGGTLRPFAEQVFEAGELCPNMTLEPERDDDPMPRSSGGKKHPNWNSAQKLKAQNDRYAAIARQRADDSLQVDADTSLADIVRERPGHDYCWTCCYSHATLQSVDNAVSQTASPYSTHEIGSGGNKLMAGTFERSGPAGGWSEVKVRRSIHNDLIGRVETVEPYRSETWALQFLLGNETRNADGKFQSFTVFVTNDVLMKNESFKSMSADDTARALLGKKLHIKRGRIIDRAGRTLKLEVPGDFELSTGSVSTTQAERQPRKHFRRTIGRINAIDMASGNPVLEVAATGEDKAYSVMIRLDVLRENRYFSGVPKATFDRLEQQDFGLLRGRTLTIVQAAFTGDSDRKLLIERANDFTISTPEIAADATSDTTAASSSRARSGT